MRSPARAGLAPNLGVKIVDESNGLISKESGACTDLATGSLLFLWLLPFAAILVWGIYLVQPEMLAALTVIPRWVWPPMGLLAALLTWRRRRMLPWRLSVILWCLFVGVYLEEVRSMGRLAIPVTDVSPESIRLCVLSVNCSSSGTVIEDLLPDSPDLILIQESPSRDQLQQWGEQLWGDDFGIVFAQDCAILARGQLIETAIDRQGIYAMARWRPTAEVEIDVTSLRLWPPPVRADYWTPDCWRSYAEVRRRQVNQIGQILTQLASSTERLPLIVGGDFNSPAGDVSEQSLHELNLRDAFVMAGRGWGKTITNDFPFHRIDRIWTSPSLRTISVTAHSTRHTDHRLVKCLLDISTPET